MLATALRSKTTATFLSFLALVLAQWVLFGFNIPGQSDEWVHLARMEYVPLTFAPDLRPLLRLPWAVAYWLTPGSFLGLNGVLAAALLVKGLALYGILRRLLPEYPALAYAAGVLFVIYPADDAVFALYVVGIHVSVACYLVAVYCLLVYWQKPGIGPVVGIWAMLLIALGIVEIAYPLVLVTPLVLRLAGVRTFAQPHPPPLSNALERGVQPPGNPWLLTIFVWYSIPALLLGWAVFHTLQGVSAFDYQSARLASDNSLPALISSLLNTYRWQLWEAWPNALTLIGPVRLTSPHTWVTLACGLMAGGVTWWHTRAQKPDLSTYMLRWVLVIGIGMLGLGFLPFLPSAFRDSSERTTLFSSIGAVIILALVMLVLTRSSRPIRYGVAIVLLILALDFFVLSNFSNRLTPLLMSMIAIGLFIPERWRYGLVMVGLVGICTAYSLNRHEKHIARGLRQEPILTSLAAAVPGIAPQTILLLFDESSSNEIASTFWWRYDVVNHAVKYLYADASLEGYLCVQDRSSGQTALGYCQLDEQEFQIIFNYDARSSFERSYERVLALSYSSEGVWQVIEPDELEAFAEAQLSGYVPASHLDSSGASPDRLRSIYDHPPLDWRDLFKG